MKPKNFDDYIAQYSKDVQAKLQEIRAAIKDVAPDAQERISYGMPYFHYKGRLAYFAAFKDHISLFAVPPIVEEHKEELKKYKISKSTIQFRLDQDLPIALIKKLVKARVKKNDEAEKEKR